MRHPCHMAASPLCWSRATLTRHPRLNGTRYSSCSLTAPMTSRPLPARRDSTPTLVRREPAPATPAYVDGQSGPDWRRIGSALLRFKWIVALMVLLGLGAAFAATRVMRPVYRAQTNVWVDVPDRRGESPSDARGPIRQGALLDADDWVELLRSYIVLDQVVRDQRLYLGVNRPAHRPGFATLGVRAAAGLRTFVVSGGCAPGALRVPHGGGGESLHARVRRRRGPRACSLS